MARAIVRGTEVQREVLAGNNGRCSGYKRTDAFGHAREPFTWLSDDALDVDNEAIAEELRSLQRSRAAAKFEAWEVEDEMWQMIHSGRVNVLYVELDSRISKVRALLQWVPVTASNDEPVRQRQAAW